jgi:ATP-dependent 26S proteasome regulatory subunit
MDKYLGESDKMVSAIFRVARKLAPTVVFIDEIDTVLRKRGGLDNAGVQSMQVCKQVCVSLCLILFLSCSSRSS